MALGYDYLVFDSLTLPWATANSEDVEHVENAGMSEAGTDLVITTRLNKPTFNYTFRVTSWWADKLKTEVYSKLSGMLYINGDAGHEVRPRLQNKTLVPGSELTAGTDGLYDISISFIEK